MSNTIGNNQNIRINESIVAPIGQPGVDIAGVLSSGNNLAIENLGSISGAVEGVGSDGNTSPLIY